MGRGRPKSPEKNILTSCQKFRPLLTHHMSTQIKVFIPLLSTLCTYPHTISYVGELRRAIWNEESASLRDHGGRLLHQISLRSLVYPVPLEPENTLRKRIVDSARGNRWADIKDGAEVPPGWRDLQNVHVYLHVDLGPRMQAAERLYDKLWGTDLSVILEEISDKGNTWKYVPKKHIDSLNMADLGYPEGHGLLVRQEYEVAWGDFDFDTARCKDQGGVVVTGQPGIGTPVSLQLAPHILVFRDDGVYRHSQEPEPGYIPTGRQTAWIIQTTSPLETRWKGWAKQYTADTFVMNGFSAAEITALGKVQGLDASALLRNYEKWGPSARTCVRLVRDPQREFRHAIVVNNAADAFVERPPPRTTFDAIEVFDVLFSVRPEVEENGGRTVPVAEMATEHIKRIISCAAAGAEAHKRIKFYRTISTQAAFKGSAGDMFEGFVLSWLYAGSGEPLRCSATGLPQLEIPACGEEKTTFFGGKNSLGKVKWDKLPLCLLPTARNFPTADAIVVTDEFIITIQLSVSYKHKAKDEGFKKIKELISPHAKREKWRHVFVTDGDGAAASFLLNQDLPDIPKHVVVYSTVFDIGRSAVTRENMEAFNEKRLIGGIGVGDSSLNRNRFSPEKKKKKRKSCPEEGQLPWFRVAIDNAPRSKRNEPTDYYRSHTPLQKNDFYLFVSESVQYGAMGPTSANFGHALSEKEFAELGHVLSPLGEIVVSNSIASTPNFAE
ncbi:hypothetical protein EDB86DRAFT_3241318 [Lactarius hatsudake]|nr:hypothetical protein EDB86DRAFT_3241318 [Lactarius hatsudake]